MSTGQIILVATPVFLLLIALEFAWGCKSKRNASAYTTVSLVPLEQARAF